jgi:hypothetical protein
MCRLTSYFVLLHATPSIMSKSGPRFQGVWPPTWPMSLPERLRDTLTRRKSSILAFFRRTSTGDLSSVMRFSLHCRSSCPHAFRAGPQSADSLKNLPEKCPWHNHFGHLKYHVPRMPDTLAPILISFSRSVRSDQSLRASVRPSPIGFSYHRWSKWAKTASIGVYIATLQLTCHALYGKSGFTVSLTGCATRN